MAKQRHTSFGGRADSAPDTKRKAKDPTAAERMRRLRDKKKGLPVTPSLRSALRRVTPNVTESVTVTQAQSVTPVTAPVTVPYDVQVLADGLKLALAEVKSLVKRMDAMERWAEALEAKYPKIRIAASPLQGSSSSVPASVPTISPRVMRPGDMVEVNGRMVKVPTLDADGRPIPE